MPLYNFEYDCLRIVPINSDGETAASIDKGRVFRDAFHEDVARVVHSPSFRRLHRKRQLLPYEDSDFVRTRSSHSNEVAQIATSIGAHLNNRLRDRHINERIKPDLLVFAGLVHDLGHPPFGHLGEKVLNEKMLDAGGFEGNAQTLRIISKLERRFSTGSIETDDSSLDRFAYDDRTGINPTLRSAASILKYCEVIKYTDDEIHNHRGKPRLKKGYYESERYVVEKIIENISAAPIGCEAEFFTIEASIMDFADDIAYSIYDLEDCFRMGVLKPEQMFSLDNETLESISEDVRKKISNSTPSEEPDSQIRADSRILKEAINPETITQVLINFFHPIMGDFPTVDGRNYYDLFRFYVNLSKRFDLLATNSEVRRSFTENYIQQCIFNCDIEYNSSNPPLSKILIDSDVVILIETLKRINYELVIESDMIKSSEYKGEHILERIFDSLFMPGDEFKESPRDITGYLLLPDETRRQIDVEFVDPALSGFFGERIDSTDDHSDLVNEKELLRGICESAICDKVPLISGYSVERALSVKDIEIRIGVVKAIYGVLERSSFDEFDPFRLFSERRSRIKRVICDYIASMTDRGAIEFYNRLFSEGRLSLVDDHNV